MPPLSILLRAAKRLSAGRFVGCAVDSRDGPLMRPRHGGLACVQLGIVVCDEGAAEQWVLKCGASLIGAGETE